MTLAINSHKLHAFLKEPFVVPSAGEMRRQGAVFFIGGNLPVLEALETMYESHCQDSTGLFHVMMGTSGEVSANLEMVRQIKKNFSVRLMGRVNYRLPGSLFEQLYLAGLDFLDIPWHVIADETGLEVAADVTQAVSVFTRWSLVSSIPHHTLNPKDGRWVIDSLLEMGIVPLLTISERSDVQESDRVNALYAYLAEAWQRHEVPLTPLLPLINLATPLETGKHVGIFRSVINRIHDRKMQVSSDLRRHLRTSGAEASFESAGL